ncbi:MAG TPA: VOC family protein, partial [Gemmatimonadales bacterium]
MAHVGIAVEDITAALTFYTEVLGLAPGRPQMSDGAMIVSLHFGDTEVELLEPRTPDSPVAKFLAKRGPGI